jgi:hypothetical protein
MQGNSNNLEEIVLGDAVQEGSGQCMRVVCAVPDSKLAIKGIEPVFFVLLQWSGAGDLTYRCYDWRNGAGW